MDSLLSSYDYDLPPQQIAQTPVVPRDSARLLVIDSPTHHTHSVFRELPQWLQPGDLLVLNNTQVIPARLYGRKSTGAEVEVLLLEEGTPRHCWLGLVKPGKRFTPDAEIIFTSDNGNELRATVVGRDQATGGRWLQFHLPPEQPLVPLLEQYGEIPFPPYITQSEAKPEQYQTVYAKSAGAVAAPTAGLHFTPELFSALNQKGISQAEVTLHVGVGTFRPVEVEEITKHQMHSEWVDVPAETVEKIRQTKANGGRVIAVGTTVVRALEGAAAAHGGQIAPFCGKTELFIYPGYQWQVVEGLITNFHLPRSSLLMLVSALIGRERLLSLYAEAVSQGYRFYSFGDGMIILPSAVNQTL